LPASSLILRSVFGSLHFKLANETVPFGFCRVRAEDGTSA
jgi:hypothetical protein